MICNKWDIVLVPFPFTDQSSSKRRPSLVISPDEYNEKHDVVILFITSQLNTSPRPGDYKIEEWKNAGLPKASMIRMKFATIDKSIIIKKIGRLDENDRRDFSELLVDFLRK